MSVLVFAGSKGGTGKSTLVMMLAGVLARRGVDFAVVDADPTRATLTWATDTYEGPKFDAHGAENENALARLIHRLAGEHQLVVVDTPGFDNLSSNVAMTGADHILIPAKSSAADIREARATQDRVESLAMSARRPIPSRVVLTSMRTTLVARHAAEQIAALGLVPLASQIGHRAEYETLTHTGIVAQKGAAHGEIVALMTELTDLGWLP